jgi:hypothetical protein
MNIDHFVRKSRGESGSALFKLTLDLNRFTGKEKDHNVTTQIVGCAERKKIIRSHRHQIVETARDLRISRSAVTKRISSINAVAAMIRSTGSFGKRAERSNALLRPH